MRKILPFFTLFLLTCNLINSQIAFDLENIQSGSLVDGVRAIEIGDLDGDGDQDLVSASDNSSGEVRLVWYENDGTGSFTANLISSSLNVGGMRHLKLVDLDGDFNMDILGSSNSRIIFVKNNGDGTFTPLTILDDPKIGSIFGIDAGDLDFDGDPDIVVPARGQGSIPGSVFWLKNNGGGSFTEMPSFWNTNNAHSVKIFDFDNDNDNDVIATRNSGTDAVRAFSNDGNGNFTNAIIESSFGARNIAVGDTDSDGNQEILISFRDRDEIRKYIYDRVANTWSRVIVSTPSKPEFIKIEDVNQDGIGDILVATFLNDNFYWLESDGSGTNYTTRLIDNNTSTAGGAIGMVSLDIDGDTDIDLIGASFSSDVITLYRNPTIVLSTSEFLFNKSFTVYPNPASEFIQIKNSTDLKLTNVLLYDVTGRLIVKDIDITKRIDVSSLPKGVYFLNVISEKKKFVKKIVLSD